MEEYCQDPFWDSDLTWNNSWPQITECFQSSFLLPLPCFYLGLFLPWHLYSLCREQSKERTLWDMLFILKTVCCLVLAVVEMVAITLCFQEFSGNFPVAVLFEHFARLISFILVIVTNLIEHKKSTLHSQGLFFFFLFLVITHLVPFYSKIILEEYLTATGTFIVFYIKYATLLCAVALYCLNNKQPNSKLKTAPEEHASILSTLTIWWTTMLVIRGYKKPLTEVDIYTMNTSEKAVTVVPDFLDHLSLHTRSMKQKLRKSPPAARSVHNRARYTKTNGDLDTNPPPLLQNEAMTKTLEIFENGHVQLDSTAVECKVGNNKNSDKGLGLFLWKVILHTFYKHIFMCCLLELVVLVCVLSSPLIMKLLIEFMSRPEEYSWHGYFLATVLFLASTLGHFLYEFYMFQTNKFAIRVKTSIVSAIYRKSLCLSSEARQACSSGEIIHLLSKDCDAIWSMCDEGFILIESPIELTVGLILVYRVVGVAMFAGLATMGLLFLLKAFTAHKHSQYDRQLKKHADERMKIASQVFSGIKALKLYAWEEAFKSLMCAIREKELKVIFKYDLFRTFITFAWTSAIFWMIFFTFMTYIYIDASHHLTAVTVFVTMIYFTYIRRAANCIAAVTDIIVAGVNSAKRVAKFLMLQELEETSSSRAQTTSISQDTAVCISAGHFGWSSKNEAILHNINVDIPKGSLVAVVGMVGSGKSSLLSAILGEMVIHHGHLHKQGSIAYIPQQAWIQNDSLHNNILFGSEHKEEEYNQVIEACALKADLSILPHGDQTEIGERGINLSGGQKQRVSLARAVYQGSDIYLLDAPLSAVDSHVGQHIFQQVIGKNGLLKAKTRILVTHGIHWLSEVDQILVLTNGHLTEQGSLEELMTNNGPFAQFLSQYLSQLTLKNDQHAGTGDANSVADGCSTANMSTDLKEELENEKSRKDLFERLLSIESQRSEAVEQEDKDAGDGDKTRYMSHEVSQPIKLQHSKSHEDEDESGRLIAEEEVASGRVQWSVYTTFAKTMGYAAMIFLAFMYLSFYIFDLVNGFWLTFWVDDLLLNNGSLPADSPVRTEQNNFFLTIYSLWGILETLVVVAFNIVKAFRHKQAARIIHETLITSVLASPIQFFDTTPVGRILSRFSKDISVVDTTLLMWMEVWMHAVFAIMSVILVIIINLPIFLLVTVPVVLLFYIIERFYLPTSCQLRRLESKWLSPLFSHASESFAGTSVIRASGEEKRFIQTAEEKLDFCQQMKYASLACERWLSIRLGLLSDLLVLFTGLLVVTYRDELSPGLTGLCLSMILIITNQMQLQVRVASFLEMDIVSMERILQYSDLPSEAPRHLSCPEYSKSWPTVGSISFNSVCVCYRPGLDLVLKNVSFQVRDGEKVGIVGRTGAGKSSLLLALFRLIEPCGGNIVIDGLDISKLGLYQLRQKLTILPQDPVLFTGTLRRNLDPFEQFTCQDIWQSLDHCHLKSFVETLPQGLDFPVGEGGSNLSTGQCQLVCLGRALLRKTKILVLDEATAAVDVETDELIQKTIRSEFSTCTVLTIAHRLNTIMDYDRILVLDQGQVVEFDTPSTLLHDTNSLFYNIAAETHHALSRWSKSLEHQQISQVSKDYFTTAASYMKLL